MLLRNLILHVDDANQQEQKRCDTRGVLEEKPSAASAALLLRWSAQSTLFHFGRILVCVFLRAEVLSESHEVLPLADLHAAYVAIFREQAQWNYHLRFSNSLSHFATSI